MTPEWTNELLEEFLTWLGDRKPTSHNVNDRIIWYNDRKNEFIESKSILKEQLLLG